MLRQAWTLWKQEKHNKGTSLQRRLIAFFAVVVIFILLSFTALLLAFGITGSGRNTVYNYTANELCHLHTAITEDFGRLAVQGVSFAENAASSVDEFCRKNKIRPDALAAHPALLEPLLAIQMPLMLSVMERNTCGGVFILLDATVNPDMENAANSKAGIFIKKTQPNTIQAVGAKKHYLRGPAQIARNNGIELLGQWKMEYDIRGEEFFLTVMQNARKNPEKPLSRLYYWTGRMTLKGNSEAGFLLCIPLRSEDGSVFGVCGVEVSDRMFKQVYSPNESDYENVFACAAPTDGVQLFAKDGMIAGNYYLTGSRMEETLEISGKEKGFYFYSAGGTAYGGLHTALRLYPSDSVYEDESWAAAVMMPETRLRAAISGRTSCLLIIVLLLLVISLGVSVFISRRYLRPVTDALNTIKSKNYRSASNPYLEINDLMEFLAQQDEIAKNRQLAISKPDGDVTPMFEEFLKNIQTLSQAEKSVFDLYIRGYKAQEIAEELFLSINTIKTHNRRIFAKLNVSSRKELLVYIDMMKEMNIIREV